MPPPKRHPHPHYIIHKLGPLNRLGRHPLFHPLHQRSEDISLPLKPYPLCSRITTLTENPRPGPRIAMKHARNAKEAEESIHVVGRSLHPPQEVLVESVGIEAGDLVILLPMIGDDLPASGAKRRERRRPRADVRRVQRFCGCGGRDGECGWVPVRVRVDDVAEPILGVAERFARIKFLHGQDLAAGLHGWVDELSVFAVEGAKDFSDHLDLNVGETVCGGSSSGGI